MGHSACNGTIPGPLPGSTIFLHLSVSGPPYPDHPTRTILFWPLSLDYPAFWTTIREPLPESTTRSGPHYLDLYSLTFSRMDRIFLHHCTCCPGPCFMDCRYQPTLHTLSPFGPVPRLTVEICLFLLSDPLPVTI